MNYNFFRKKIIEFLYNFSVISIGVSVYDNIWYGFIVGLIAVIIATILALFVKE